ncbi:MAG: hypothetical protein ACUVT7_09110 [Thermoplasmata archaeon]
MKAVATVIAYAPALMFRLGLGYLGLRKQAHKSARLFEEGLIEGGMPAEYASLLTNAYESDLRFSKMIGKIGSWPKWHKEDAEEAR